jgi:hypothetical protein
MHLQLGGDGLSMNIFGSYSAQVCGVRCEDMHPDDAYTRMAWRILYIVEGPKECANHNQILQPTIDTALRYCPALREGEAPLDNNTLMGWMHCHKCIPLIVVKHASIDIGM